MENFREPSHDQETQEENERDFFSDLEEKYSTASLRSEIVLADGIEEDDRAALLKILDKGNRAKIRLKQDNGEMRGGFFRKIVKSKDGSVRILTRFLEGDNLGSTESSVKTFLGWQNE